MLFVNINLVIQQDKKARKQLVPKRVVPMKRSMEASDEQPAEKVAKVDWDANVQDVGVQTDRVQPDRSVEVLSSARKLTVKIFMCDRHH